MEAKELGGGVGDDRASWGVLVGERCGERCGEGMKKEGKGERGRRCTLVAFVDEEDGDRLRV